VVGSGLPNIVSVSACVQKSHRKYRGTLIHINGEAQGLERSLDGRCSMLKFSCVKEVGVVETCDLRLIDCSLARDQS